VLFLGLGLVVLAHAIFDVIVDDKVEFFVCETVVFGECVIDFINDGFSRVSNKFGILAHLNRDLGRESHF